MTKTGAPPKLTPERKEIILKALQLGAAYVHAANAAGITYTCFNNWMKLGEEQINWSDEDRNDYFAFFTDVKRVEAEEALENLDIIREAAKNKNWYAAAWKLERRHKKEYGRTDDNKELLNELSDEVRETKDMIKKIKEY